MKLLWRYTLLCCLLCSSLQQLHASHLAAADLNYRCLGGNQYEITLKLYRDCGGINIPTSPNINISSTSCGNTFVALTLQTVRDITPVCATNPSACSGGVFNGYQEAIYTGTVTLSPCADWLLSYSSCCRNSSAQNMQAVSAQDLYVDAMLNNSSGACNSSPQFANPPIFMICDSIDYNVTHHAIEADGDSLVYSLATPLDGPTQPLSYTTGFSTSQPFPTHGGGATFDPNTGQLSFIPDGPFVSIFDVLVEEYRNGQLIGSSRRSLQLAILSCNNNQALSLNHVFYKNQGVWQAQGTSTDFQVCPGETLEFMLDISDADTMDVLSLDSLRTSLLIQYPNAGIQFNMLSTNHALVEVSIPAVQLGSFSMGFKDDACPINHLQSWIFRVLPRPSCALIRVYAALDNAPANCAIDALETPIPGALVTASKNGVVLYGTTDANGYCEIIADTGTYTVNFNNYLSSMWQPCSNNISTALATFNTVDTVEFAVQGVYANCPALYTDIGTALLRRCFSNVYHVQYGNIGSANASNVALDVMIDTNYIRIDSASIPYTVNGNIYNFQLGQVDVFDQNAFQIYMYTLCDTSIQGHTACIEAHIYPDSLCYASSAWDGVDVQVAASCMTDSIVFTIENQGADMTSAYNYRLLEDGVLIQTSNFQLMNGGQQQFVIPTNGATYRLETDQSPNHPSSSNPSVTVENCAALGTGISIGWVNIFAEDDGALFLSTDCQEIRGSWDPNEKIGYPQGYGPDHYIPEGQELEYVLHFQNTGTDTAFNVVLVDTLPSTLNPNSIKMGTSSDAYRWELSGNNQAVLKIYFDNIMLPDSNVNEPASHGFVKFKIQQASSNSIGTRIENFVDIYFDFNPPVRTNTAFHTIGEDYITLLNHQLFDTEQELELRAYPNPFRQQVTIELLRTDAAEIELELYDVMGRLVKQARSLNSSIIVIDAEDLPSAVYFYRLYVNGQSSATGQLIKQ